MLTKGIVLLFSFACSVFLSLYICQIIAERYFFDKVIYDKSPIHGYNRYLEAILHHKKYNPFIAKRLESLINLVDYEKINNNKSNSMDDVTNYVLGTKTENIYNVAVIGDSFAYGTGVMSSQTFSSILEDKLQNITRSRVYNLSMPGANIVDYYTIYKIAEERLNIDLYIIGMVDDDLLYFGTDAFLFPNKDIIYEQLIKECTKPMYAYSFTFDVPWDQVILEGIYPSFSVDYGNTCVLRKIVKDISKSTNIFINLNTNPIRSLTEIYSNPSEASRKKSESLFIYAKIIEESGGNFLDPHKKEGFIFEKISESEGHSSKETHRFQAEVLYNEIVINPIYEFPEN
jgi:hypothetical protein